VLRSLARQGDRRFEVVVADDGSGPATTTLIEQWQPQLGVSLLHARHEHRGFRVAEIRNRAIRASSGDYCVFLDGDCLARPDFVARHRALAESGWFVTGNRALLTSSLTEVVLRQRLGVEGWRTADWIRQRFKGGLNRLAPLLRLPLGPLRRCALKRGEARAPAISQSGVATSTGSMVSMPISAVGGARIPISWYGCCMPACAGKTVLARPACCICGIQRPTAPGFRITSSGLRA
jgi:hypothetical protein